MRKKFVVKSRAPRNTVAKKTHISSDDFRFYNMRAITRRVLRARANNFIFCRAIVLPLVMLHSRTRSVKR